MSEACGGKTEAVVYAKQGRVGFFCTRAARGVCGVGRGGEECDDVSFWQRPRKQRPERISMQG